MKKDSFAAGFCIIVLVVIVLYIIGAVSSANEPKCKKSGCDNKQASGSSYCYLHKPYKSNNGYSNNSDNSYSHSATTETTKSKYNNTSSGSMVSTTTESSSYKYNSSNTGSPYKSYDDGYDASMTMMIMIGIDTTVIWIMLMEWMMPWTRWGMTDWIV